MKLAAATLVIGLPGPIADMQPVVGSSVVVPFRGQFTSLPQGPDDWWLGWDFLINLGDD